MFYELKEVTMLEVLDKIRELAKRNRIEFTYHARLRITKEGLALKT